MRLSSSLRSRGPLETLRIARGLMSTFGISRVTDVTAMDRLGLPVFVSVRPRGRALRVHAGKGLEPIEAQVGALMEAIEYAAAEPQRSMWPMKPLTAAMLAAQFEGELRLADFAPPFGSKITPQHIVETVECEDISRQSSALIPADLVFVPHESAYGNPFGWTTNGLASGNSLDEATAHALLEVLERDAVSMNKTRKVSQRIDTHELPMPFSELASTWKALGVDLVVRYLPNEFELPCFEAFLHEGGDEVVNLAGGSALHPNREIALTRAICEAAQSRLSHIHGGRDDVTRFYSKYAERDASFRSKMEKRQLEAIFDVGRVMHFDAVPQEMESHTSAGDILGDLLERLSRVRFNSVFRYRFPMPSDSLHVVKMVVPKCEDIEHSRRIGPRLLASVIGNA
jgi:ribosomal protein S12 methylthiotransferase accessory factor